MVLSAAQNENTGVRGKTKEHQQTAENDPWLYKWGSVDGEPCCMG